MDYSSFLCQLQSSISCFVLDILEQEYKNV